MIRTCKNTGFFILFALIICACKSNTESKNDSELIKWVDESSFTEEIQLNVFYDDEISQQIGMPLHLEIIENTLIVSDVADTEYMLKFFSIEDSKLLKNFAKRGPGPLEFDSSVPPKYFAQHHSDTSSLQFFHWGSKRVIKSSIDDILSDSIKEFDPMYVLPPELFYAQYATFLNDSTILAADDVDAGHIALLEINTNDITYAPFFKQPNPNLTIQERRQLYSGFPFLYREKATIAYSMRHFKQIMFFNLEGDYKKIVRFDDYEHYELNKSEEPLLHFGPARGTEEYLYVQYYGYKNSERDNLPDGLWSLIYVFDWDGNPIRKIKINGHQIGRIVIDQLRNRIYGVDFSDPEMRIVYVESDYIR